MSNNSLTITKILGVMIMLIALFSLAVWGFLLKNSGATIDQNLQLTQNLVEEKGALVLPMTANAGFTPNEFVVPAGKSVILRVSTENTFDCSNYISIPKIDVRQQLPITGSTDIAIVAQSKGTELEGSCSLNLYKFKIKYI
jgi:plastocyanin domain-containing protein